MKFRRIEAGSYYTYLPEGCRICRKGAKLTLFLTGKCHSHCFYCPVSFERRNKDSIYANERAVESIDDFIEEVELMSAEGVAITGGEPLLKIERVRKFIDVSKKLDLHIHIYTSIPADERILRKLSGVDEVRFHPPELRGIEKYKKSILTAKKLGMDAGFEIPAVKYEPEIVRIVNECDAFLNVNQLEVSETNYRILMKMGYRIVDYYVESDKVVKQYERARKFHYCSAKFKDSAQFRRRLIRMAMNHPEFYKVTRDGTIICCLIEGSNRLEVAEEILKNHGFDYVRVDEGFETDIEVVEKIGELLKAEGFRLKLIERYPTSRRIVLEVQEI
jgi:hypothetical protein